MKISVITVCYNSAETITDALQSVANQTWPDVEHIVIDGASTDGTQAVIGLHGTRVARVVSEPDAGIYDAMNKGLCLASGEVIAFLNADDVYSHARVLESVAECMQKEGLDALYGDTEFVRPEDLRNPIRRYRSERFHPNRIAWGWMPAHPALFLRRQVFERYGGFRVDYRIAGDFELIARIFYKNKLSYRYVPAVFVRMRTGGVSTSGFRSIFLLNREVLRACKENGIRSNWLMVLSKYPAKLIEFLRK